MKKLLGLGIVFAALGAVIFAQSVRIRALRADRDVYRRNTEALLDSVGRYRTREGLNVATVRNLELKLGEFEHYRAGDAALIRTLRADIRDLERVTTTRTATIYRLEATARDTVVIRGNGADTAALKCVEYRSPWLDFAGCIDAENRFMGTVESRDSLMYVETVERARFLGFLWRTRRVKGRRQEIVSRNPHTVITSAEFVTIRK